MSDETPLPPGLYDLVVDGSLARRIAALNGRVAREEPLDELDLLRDRLVDLVRREIASVMDDDGARLDASGCLALIDGLLRHCRGGVAPLSIVSPVRRLTGISTPTAPVGDLPSTGLHASFLFTAGKASPSLHTELRTELSTVDAVDILVSFITWSGVRKLDDVFRSITAVGAAGRPRTRVRILTTTYCGNTERRAIDWLAKLPGVEVRISLDGSRTRLHAKAWILRRESGFGSAYVGSANLSAAALTGGLEWTVKFTEAGDSALFTRAGAHFETLWNDSEFQPYDPSNAAHVEALDRALERESVGPRAGEPGVAMTWIGIEPRPFQVELLDRLEAERRHGRFRNLLVAATGTGKTVVAAFDYHRTCEVQGGRPRLLFVAHRKEILTQARRVFGAVLREFDFGTVLADGTNPSSYEHCFATIQSVNARELVERCGADYWDTVILDECHHAAAVSYERLLALVKPRVLLGLTATPERADGKNILDYFDRRPDGAPSAELRLWQALDQELLCPFEYYGCADDTDLTLVPWDRADERKVLDSILGTNDVRARTALEALQSRVSDVRRARVLGFCVSVAHAEFMADYFRAAGIPAEAVSGGTPSAMRQGAPARLDRREVNVLFTCDLYNEGIDIPSVDTLLFLRPTQSAVVFQQQLGRGLRRLDKKESCVVVDLVGRHRVEFRFDRLLGVLTGLPRAAIAEQVEYGFGSLPPGCHIQLDRISREQVLRSLKAASTQRWNALAAELAAYSQLTGRATPGLGQFMREHGVDLGSIYASRGQGPSGWTALRRDAGLLRHPIEPYEREIGRRMPSLIHHDDPVYLGYLDEVAEGRIRYGSVDAANRRRLDMLAGELFPGRGQEACDGEELLTRLSAAPTVRDELRQLAELLDESTEIPPVPLPGFGAECPLQLHSAYTLRELMMGVGWIAGRDRHVPQAGVLALHDQKIELLIVTLDKSAGFSSRTAYHDYAVSPTRFHWQTQNSCGPDTTAGQRYVDGARNGWTFQLFVRETKQDAYRTLGPATLVSATGDRPMSIVWELQVPLSAALFRRYSVLRSA